jgi:hypothetical protein
VQGKGGSGMPKKRLYVIAIAVIFFALSAVLAALLILGNKEPEARQIEIFKQLEKSEEGIQGFVFVEPGPYVKKHIGDPIKVIIAVGYDSQKWEVPHDLEKVFLDSSFLPDKFKTEERKLSKTKRGKLILREVSIIVRCLECREGTYEVRIDTPDLFPRARNKKETTNNIRSIRFLDTGEANIEFAALTDSGFKISEDLVSVTPVRQEKWRWLVAATSMIIALASLGFIMYIIKNSRGSGVKEIIAIDKKQEIAARISKAETADVLYNLLVIFMLEFGDESGNISDILEHLKRAYSKEGISEAEFKEFIEGSIKWTQ